MCSACRDPTEVHSLQVIPDKPRERRRSGITVEVRRLAAAGCLDIIPSHYSTLSAVLVPRADAGIIVTEYGSADLRGLSLPERQKRMIAIAAPEFREALSRQSRCHGPSLGR